MHRTPRRTPWSISTTVNPETFFGISDDVASALDFDGQDQVAALLATTRATLLVVTHEQTVVEQCGRVVDMASGKLRERRGQ